MYYTVRELVMNQNTFAVMLVVATSVCSLGLCYELLRLTRRLRELEARVVLLAYMLERLRPRG